MAEDLRSKKKRRAGIECRDLLSAFFLAPMLPILAPIALASCICDDSRGIRLPRIFASDCGCRDDVDEGTEKPSVKQTELEALGERLKSDPVFQKAVRDLLTRPIKKSSGRTARSA